jgi:hypothetical protein
MQQTFNAVLAVIAVVLIGFCLALFTGFWPAVIPLLVSDAGPAGLSEDFSLSIVSTALGALAQVVLTFFIVQFIVTRRERLNLRIARRRLADGIADMYQVTATKIAVLRGILPGPTSDRSMKKTHRMNQLLWRFDRSIDESEEEKIREMDELFDAIIFEQRAVMDEFDRSLEVTMKTLCPDPVLARVMRAISQKRRPPKWQILKNKVADSVQTFIEKRQIKLNSNSSTEAALN